MKSHVIVGTGQLVAPLNPLRLCAVRTLQEIAPPMLMCEAVLAEATYLTRSLPGARAALMEMIGEGFCPSACPLADHHSALLAMVRRYGNVPMSLADACRVRLAELHPQCPVLTLDSDFLVYRKNRRQVIEVLMAVRGYHKDIQGTAAQP